MKQTLQSQALELIGKNWSKASLTREKLISGVKSFAAFLEKSYGLEKIGSLKPGHIEGYVASMKAAGLSPSTMCGRMTAVRVVAQAVGKKGIVSPSNAAYGIERVRYAPQEVNREKLAEIRAKVEARAVQGDKRAMMLRATSALRSAGFALRPKESLLSARVVERDGRDYLQVQGAKGGRPRELDLDTPAKVAAVQLVKETAAALGSKTGRAIPPEKTLKQAYDAQRNLWRELGGTRKNHANMYADRHQGLRDVKAAAKAAGKSERESNREVNRLAGHGDERSLASYIP